MTPNIRSESTKPANVAVTEDAEAAAEEAACLPVSLRTLHGEELDEGLGGGQLSTRLCHVTYLRTALASVQST